MSGAAEYFRSELDGFAACGLRNQKLELVVVPALGANIVSLRSLASGREWMWRRPDPARLFANAWGDAFPGSPLRGAVECIPTIAVCTVAGRQLPDHGEAWTAVWELDEAALLEGEIRTSVRLPVSELEFTRSIRMEGTAVRFEYRVVNRGLRATACLWAFHPLLRIEADDRLELPESIVSLRAKVSRGFGEPGGRAVWEWPEVAPGLRLDRVGDGLPPNSFAKLFADFTECGVGWAALSGRAERLEFRFDPATIPYLGLWLTNGGWNDLTHLAIEPASAATDSLADAIATPLEPGGERAWRFEIHCLAKEASCGTCNSPA